MLQNNTYKIKVNSPCQEDWSRMTDTSVGKFCNSCKKEVIDFTNFSNEQISDYFIQNGLKSGCGKFLNTQIEQIRITIDEDLIVHKLSYWSKFMIALLICFGANCINATVTFGQIIKPDTSIAKQQCDTFNTGESYHLAEKSITQNIKDSIITDSSITAMAKDTAGYEVDTLKLVLDTSLKSLELKFDLKYEGRTLGFFVQYLDDKFIEVEEISQETGDLIVPNIFSKIKEENLETKNEPLFSENNNLVNKQETPTPPQNNSLAFEAILPNDEKKKKKR